MNEELQLELPTATPWGPWATVGSVVGIFALVSFIQILLVGVITARESFNQPSANLQTIAVEIAANGDVLAWGVVVSALITIPLVILMVVLRANGPSIKAYLGLGNFHIRDTLMWLGAGFVITTAYSVLALVLGRPLVDDTFLGFFTSADQLVLLWTAVVLFAPLSEEILFRGFLIRGLQGTRLGNTGAIALSAITWAAIHFHYGAFEISYLVILGVLLGVARVTTNSIYTCIIVHAMNNIGVMVACTYYADLIQT